MRYAIMRYMGGEKYELILRYMVCMTCTTLHLQSQIFYPNQDTVTTRTQVM